MSVRVAGIFAAFLTCASIAVVAAAPGHSGLSPAHSDEGTFEAIHASVDTAAVDAVEGAVVARLGASDIAQTLTASEVAAASVPLPAGLPMLLIGLGGIVYLSRVRRT